MQREVPGLSKVVERFAEKLIEEPSSRDAFLAALSPGRQEDTALIWFGNHDVSPFNSLPPVSWQPPFVQRVAQTERPGNHRLHAAGAYYCLDMASVFMGAAALEMPSNPVLLVDVCASPGGKSALFHKALAPRLLIANETIGKRLPALISNIKRCAIGPAMVVHADPNVLPEALNDSVDVVVVDAPCSGQSLAAKGEKPGSAFHPVTINKSAMRQRRIIANSASLVAPGGYLAYMTCTFSLEENEHIVAWLLKKRSDFVPVPIKSLACYESPFSEIPCYRLWPQQKEGAGGFTALFRRAEGERAEPDLSRLRCAWKSG